VQEIGRQPLHNLGVRKLLAVTLVLSGLAFTQGNNSETLTARQYYEELKVASGINGLATLVCFRPDDSGIFDLLAFTKDVEATAKARGITLTPEDRKMFNRLDSLFITTYKKGVKTGEGLMTHDKDNAEDWYDDRQFEGHKMRLVITLSPAGRYRRAVYVDKSSSPRSETYGKCEPIQ
jgi:hypothetical protein